MRDPLNVNKDEKMNDQDNKSQQIFKFISEANILIENCLIVVFKIIILRTL